MAKRRSEPDGSSSESRPSPSGAPAEVPSFEEALARLRTIVDELETGCPSLGQALTLYEEGIGHLRRCQELLEGAEQQIERLTGVTRTGAARVVPLDGRADCPDDDEEGLADEAVEDGEDDEPGDEDGDDDSEDDLPF